MFAPSLTYQELIYKDKVVFVSSIKSKSGKAHAYVSRYLGLRGIVQRESKGGMLLVKFGRQHYRAIPAGCVSLADSLTWAKSRK